MLEVRLFVDVQLIWGGWFYFQGLLLWTLVLSPPEELRWLRALDALDCELLLDMRLDMRPAVNTHERWAWVWLSGWQLLWSGDWQCGLTVRVTGDEDLVQVLLDLGQLIQCEPPPLLCCLWWLLWHRAFLPLRWCGRGKAWGWDGARRHSFWKFLCDYLETWKRTTKRYREWATVLDFSFFFPPLVWHNWEQKYMLHNWQMWTYVSKRSDLSLDSRWEKKVEIFQKQLWK